MAISIKSKGDNYLKSKKLILPLSLLLVLALLITGTYFLVQYITVLTADKSWIQDFGYQGDEVHDLGLDRTGCPVIPIAIAGNKFPFMFDTGSNSGFLLTSELEGKVDYTLLGQTEQLNRDGSHRGWSKSVSLNHISVFGESYSDIKTTLVDWKMLSSEKFDGTIGLKYFSSKIITMDYTGRKVAVGNRPIDYSKLNMKKYVVLPLLKSKQDGQENLLFFEAKLNGKPITVYLDTGKNESYLHNPNSTYSPSVAKSNTLSRDITIALNDMDLPLKGLLEAKLAQVTDLANPVTIELNSDQIKKNNLLVTIDLINQQIIFRRL